MKVVGLLCTLLVVASAQKENNFVKGRNSIVQLFEWKWNDVAAECERFLGPKGFGGVQISPPSENQVITDLYDRPWWERYQPVSYELTTQSGNESELENMIDRCNAVGVRIYADAVINHMAARGGVGTGGNGCDPEEKSYPAVPYDENNFHNTCSINNYGDPSNVRNCELEGLKDLDQSLPDTKNKIVAYMDHLIDLGVAGFRIDAAKHMWPEDLLEIVNSLKNLNTEKGFEPNTRPYIFQEVIDLDPGEAIRKAEYVGVGAVIEFNYGTEVGEAFQYNTLLSKLKDFGPSWGLLESDDALVFLDNHDNQRHGSGSIIKYKRPKEYKMANAYMLAIQYGKTTRIMSSYDFEDKDKGPPRGSDGNVISPVINEDGTCGGGYICEHRWKPITNMVRFRNVVEGTNVTNWWDNGDRQIAFGRGDKGFIVFTLGGDIEQKLQTSLPAGTYCDIITGDLDDGKCTGKSVEVDESGLASINLKEWDDESVLAIIVDAKL